MLNRVSLAGQTVTWIPRKIFRISYQNSNSRFFSTILLWFLFSICRFLLIPKFIFYMDFDQFLVLWNKKEHAKKRKKDNEKTHIWIGSLANSEVLWRKAQAWDPKYKWCRHMLTQTATPAPTPLSPPQMKIFSIYLLTGIHPQRRLLIHPVMSGARNCNAVHSCRDILTMKAQQRSDLLPFL